MSHQMIIELERHPANKLAACGYGGSIHHYPPKTIRTVKAVVKVFTGGKIT